MDTKNDTKKRKKILWLSTFLIITVVVVSFVIHLIFNGALLSNDTQDIINKYKETIIESVQSPTIIESEKTLEQKNEDNQKILDLQNTISELQTRIANSNSNATNYNQTIKFIVASNILLNKLQSHQPFAKELEKILILSTNINLKTKLDKIKPYAHFGIKTEEDLLKNYQKVYQQTYSAYLKNDPSFVAKLKSYFLYLIFIKKTHSSLLEDDTSVLNKLANVETYMRADDYKKAYAEFLKIEIEPSSTVKEWNSEMLQRIEANEVILEIKTELNKYTEMESK